MGAGPLLFTRPCEVAHVCRTGLVGKPACGVRAMGCFESGAKVTAMQRRILLQLLLSGATAFGARMRLQAQPVTLAPMDVARLSLLSDVVLPQEIGNAARAQVVDRFLTWIREYRPNAETDHGYGFPRLRRTLASPAAKYAAQLEALEAAAKAGGRPFAETAPEERRALIESAITAAKVERLPARPDGGHVATDLMAFFFHSIEANDLCYRTRIGRDTCRSLAGSENRPSAHATAAAGPMPANHRSLITDHRSPIADGARDANL